MYLPIRVWWQGYCQFNYYLPRFLVLLLGRVCTTPHYTTSHHNHNHRRNNNRIQGDWRQRACHDFFICWNIWSDEFPCEAAVPSFSRPWNCPRRDWNKTELIQKNTTCFILALEPEAEHVLSGCNNINRRNSACISESVKSVVHQYQSGRSWGTFHPGH